MKEKIFYIADDYAENLVKQYTNQRREKMIEELNKTIRILKFYSNNDFAFKDVHNEELFYQNGKVLVEVVQLFQEFRIIDSNSLQLLGDLFEQLLNKGFKQNEGQFFTPTPITRFIWKSLPVEKIVFQGNKTTYPKIIDYACDAGHFLTEGFEEINNVIKNKDIEITKDWVEKKLYGVEKDYRLARVSKISLFMHGAGNGNIIFGDGLECYPEKSIENNSFDILVANPPYSVSAFKPHLKLKNNDFEILKFISNDGSEIETLFVERIAQLVKPKGIAAVVLPSSILNKENNSFVGAAAGTIVHTIATGAMIGGITSAAIGTIAGGISYENGVASWDWSGAAEGFMWGSITGVISGAAGSALSNVGSGLTAFRKLGKLGYAGIQGAINSGIAGALTAGQGLITGSFSWDSVGMSSLFGFAGGTIGITKWGEGFRNIIVDAGLGLGESSISEIIEWWRSRQQTSMAYLKFAY